MLQELRNIFDSSHYTFVAKKIFTWISVSMHCISNRLRNGIRILQLQFLLNNILIVGHFASISFNIK